MTNNTLTALSSTVKDGVYTRLLDEGIDPATAYEVAFVSSWDLFENDEYGDALSTDNDSIF